MRSVRQLFSAKRARRRAAVTVEMALITPVLFILLFGVLQVGYAFVVQHALQDAAREGCRVATLRTRSNTTATTTIKSYLQSQGIDPAKTATTILVNGSAGDVSTAKAADVVQVKISMGLADAALFPGFFSSYTGTMKGVVSLRCE